MSETRIDIVYNETPGRIRVQVSKNLLKKGNVTEMWPGTGSGSSPIIPLCRDQDDFGRKGHVEIYAARADQQDPSCRPLGGSSTRSGKTEKRRVSPSARVATRQTDSC